MNVKDIKKIAILGGGGIIGSSWAVNYLWKGYPVHIYDIADDAVKTARSRIAAGFAFLVKRNVITEDNARLAMGLARYTTDLQEALDDVQ
ncbi:MAG: 3-hydroxyacyl-CoA dehydrogenase NAD-binding domain-containing protein, partial [Syntrophales bacterium]|nr:3-hydroxyacyl-CoA dehydrogenase NAD-binding domain-containing protein [Syntrophales bacterium]